jgi:hypothetical protein
MAQPIPNPILPTVASILSDFVERLKSEAIADGPTIERLNKALEEQRLDPPSLRAALFGPPKGS